MKIEHSIVITRPLAEVFAFVTDLHNETRWQPEIRSVTLEGPLAPGATFHERRITFGRQYDWHFVVTRFDPPHVIAIETLRGTAPYRGTRRFEAVPEGTRVTESGELTLPWVLRPFAGPIAWLCRWPLRRAYRRLAAMLERPTLHGTEPEAATRAGSGPCEGCTPGR